MSGGQTVLPVVGDPLVPPVDVDPLPRQGAGAQSYYPFATIVWVWSNGYPTVVLKIGDGPADGRDGNAGHLVKGGNGTGPSFEAATIDLTHDPYFIERAGASELPGQFREQIPAEFQNGLSRFFLLCINHILLPVPRISR